MKEASDVWGFTAARVRVSSGRSERLPQFAFVGDRKRSCDGPALPAENNRFGNTFHHVEGENRPFPVDKRQSGRDVTRIIEELTPCFVAGNYSERGMPTESSIRWTHSW